MQQRAALLNEGSTVELFQRGNFTPAYEQGSEWRDAHCLENARCYMRESICTKSDQGWKDSKLALKYWDRNCRQMKKIFRIQSVL